MNYGIAEQEIVARITAYITELGKTDLYEAAVIPETEQQYTEFYSNFTKARVAVQYVDSQYDAGSSTGIALQEEKAKFRLTYEARKLRGEGGLYNLMEVTKLALVGYRPSNADRLTVAKYGLLEFEQGAWQPYLEFECKTLNVQLENDGVEPPLGGPMQGAGSIMDYGA
jgi:hypothetical protein